MTTSAHRLPLAIGSVVIILGLVGYGGLYGYRALLGGDMPSHVAAKSSPEPSPPAAEPPIDATSAPQSTQDAVSPPAMPAIPPDSEAKPVTKDGASMPTDTAKSPGNMTSPKDASKSPSKSTTPPSTAAMPTSSIDAKAPTVVARAPSAATAAAQPDRWQLMREAMGRCSGETFFKRVSCEQAVGRQYCEGYWGRVPQCPSGPNKDRGQ